MIGRLLIASQWLVVFMYAKFGYFAEGEEAEHWGRFFSVTNQIIMIAWIVFLYKRKITKFAFYDAVFFNSCLALLWCQHYIPYLNEFVETYGILPPILSFIILTLLLDYFVKAYFRNK